MRQLTLVAAAIGASVVLAPVMTPVADARAPRHFRNCTALHRVYPHGVGRAGAHDRVRGRTAPVTTFKRSTRLYKANKGMDRDHDGVACEQR